MTASWAWAKCAITQLCFWWQLPPCLLVMRRPRPTTWPRWLQHSTPHLPSHSTLLRFLVAVNLPSPTGPCTAFRREPEPSFRSRVVSSRPPHGHGVAASQSLRVVPGWRQTDAWDGCGLQIRAGWVCVLVPRQIDVTHYNAYIIYGDGVADSACALSERLIIVLSSVRVTRYPMHSIPSRHQPPVYPP